MSERICAKCEFSYLKMGDGICQCPDAPVTDYLYGNKDCSVINRGGKCQFFRGHEPAPKEPPKRWWQHIIGTPAERKRASRVSCPMLNPWV